MINKKQIEGIIYEWVFDHFGESEATNPSWNTKALAKYIAEKLEDPNYKPKYKINYLIN